MSTTAGHMPAAHQHHQQWTAAKLMSWAKDVGDHVLIWVKHQLKSKEHEQQAFCVCLGMLSLSRKYSAQRLNQACGLANHHELYRLQQIKDILQSNRLNPALTSSLKITRTSLVPIAFTKGKPHATHQFTTPAPT